MDGSTAEEWGKILAFLNGHPRNPSQPPFLKGRRASRTRKVDEKYILTRIGNSDIKRDHKSSLDSFYKVSSLALSLGKLSLSQRSGLLTILIRKRESRLL